MSTDKSDAKGPAGAVSVPVDLTAYLPIAGLGISALERTRLLDEYRHMKTVEAQSSSLEQARVEPRPSPSAEDVTAIRSLISRFLLFLDAGDADLMCSLFAPHSTVSVVKMGVERKGYGAIGSWTVATHQRFADVLHSEKNITIDVPSPTTLQLSAPPPPGL
jgi:hypothetical protein